MPKILQRWLSAALIATKVFTASPASAQTAIFIPDPSKLIDPQACTLGFSVYESGLVSQHYIPSGTVVDHKYIPAGNVGSPIFRVRHIDQSLFQITMEDPANLNGQLRPADGLHINDYIYGINGFVFRNNLELQTFIHHLDPGSVAYLSVLTAIEPGRTPEIKMLKVKVKIEPPSTDLSPIRPTAIHESFAGDLGITGKDVTGIVFSIVNGQHVNNAHYQVRTLEPGMLGYLSNVQDGDIIYAIDGRTFPDNAEMQRYIQSLPIGSVAQVSTSRHDNPPDDMIVGNGGYYDGFMGLTVKEQLNGAVLKDNDWNDWIATAQVVHMNTTANTHLKVGDIIYAINGNSFPSLKAMSDYMWSQKPGTPLQVDYFSAEDSYRPKGVMLPATESQIHARIDNHNWWSAARDYAELGIAAVAVVVAVIYAKPAVPSMPAIPGITPGVPAAPGAPPIGFH